MKQNKQQNRKGETQKNQTMQKNVVAVAAAAGALLLSSKRHRDTHLQTSFVRLSTFVIK